jgi:ring-1,2-phenylacetyl-CoA epoxidase subunit PaaE
MGSALFHRLRVSTIEPDTAEAVIVSFELPEALREPFAFTQGQYLTLRTQIDGRELRRSYSICAGVDDAQLRVGVRRVAGGLFSNWVHGQLRVGDEIDVMAPQGRFFVPIQPQAQRHFLGIAGGSGITPILSILKTVLTREPRSRFTLLYGNRHWASTMFKEALEDLKNRHMARLAVHHVFSDDDAAAGDGTTPDDARPRLHEGLLNREKLAAWLHSALPPASIDHAFICGPYQMNDEAETALREAGLAPERIHIERFGLAPNQANAPGHDAVLHCAHNGDAAHAQVTVLRDGRKRSFAFERGQPSILDAATAAGLELPFSCTSGVCGTCRAKCVEGEVRMTRNFALAADDLAAGFVLACQAHPVSERVVLSFDER